MRARLGWLTLYVAVSLGPAAAALLGAPDLRAMPRAAAAFAAGGLAYAWLAAQLVLGARPKALDRAFGLDRVFRFHAAMGLAALAAVFVHAALFGDGGEDGESLQAELGAVARAMLVAIGVAAAVLFPTTPAGRWRPVARLRAWLAARARLTFERAVLLHNLAFVLATTMLAHVLLLEMPGAGPLKAVAAAYYAVGAGFYLDHKLLRRRRLRQAAWRVAAVTRETPDIVTVALDPPAGGARAPFAPGQFAFLRFEGAAGVPVEEHPFTLSTVPGGAEPATVTVKAVGDFTRALAGLEPGTSGAVLVDGPYGRFSCRFVPAGRPLCFVAGGIGVTPFLAMLRALRAEGDPRRVRLVWAARTGVELFASAELRAMERERPRFHFVSLRSREADGEGRRGRLDRAQLEAVVAAARAEEVADGAGLTEYFVCGPPGFLRDIPRALRRLGVPRRRLHVERFGL